MSKRIKCTITIQSTTVTEDLSADLRNALHKIVVTTGAEWEIQTYAPRQATITSAKSLIVNVK